MSTREEMTVKVNRLDVLIALRKNRAEHQDIYKEAIEGYIKGIKTFLANRLRDIEDGKMPNMYFSLSKPEHQLKAFDRVINMLSMSKEEEIVLTESQFSAYVMNEWDWMFSWAASNAIYSAKAASYTKQ